MKKTVFTAALALFCAAGAFAAPAETALPKPDLAGGKPLMQCFAERRSSRGFSTEKLPLQIVGEVLFAADGATRKDGRKTVPTARNKQNMELYVLTPEGTWRYEAKDNTLVKVNDKNLIPLCDQQDFVTKAPLHLLYVAKEEGWGVAHVGSAYQNVYLYAASKGMQTVIRGMTDRPALTRELELTDGKKAMLHQTVGYAE